jgi:Arc/MetJ-type ribon-helix-helix transcriptional regulator
MSTRQPRKKEFSTRLSLETLARLDQLVQSGRFQNRTAVIEAAVQRLAEGEQQEYERKLKALNEACGKLELGVDRERWRAAEIDRLEWEAGKNSGRSIPGILSVW